MKKNSLLLFFVLTYAITFGIACIVSLLLPFVIPSNLKTILAPLYRWGPALAAVLLAIVQGGKFGLADLFSRMKKWRFGLRWYLFIVLFPLGAHLLAVGLASVFGEAPPKLFYDQFGLPGTNIWLTGVLYFIGIFIQAGLAEEIGWRGFALPQLLNRFEPLTASVLLGLLWALWHFHPINLASFRGIEFWFTLQTICMCVILTWVFIHTGGSLLAAVLLHTFSNFSDWIVPFAPVFAGSEHTVASWFYRGIIFCTAALLALSLRKNTGKENQPWVLNQAGGVTHEK